MYANPSCRNKYPIFLLAYDVIFIDITFKRNEKFVKKKLTWVNTQHQRLKIFEEKILLH